MGGGREGNDVVLCVGRRAARWGLAPRMARRSMVFIMDECKTGATTAQLWQTSSSRSHFSQLITVGRSSTLHISSRSFSARQISLNLKALGEDNALYHPTFTRKRRHQEECPFLFSLSRTLAGSVSYFKHNSMSFLL